MQHICIAFMHKNLRKKIYKCFYLLTLQKIKDMAYNIQPATVLEGKSAKRFIDIVMSTQKGSIDFSKEKTSAAKILTNSKVSIF